MQTSWATISGWYEQVLVLEGRQLVNKQWFDSGKDPNRHDVPVHEFLSGHLHDEIRHAYGERVLGEVIETVEALTSGGPGAAEPPD